MHKQTNEQMNEWVDKQTSKLAGAQQFVLHRALRAL